MTRVRHRVAIAAALFVLAVVACVFAFLWTGSGTENVDQAYVKAHMGRPGFILVDVREARVYNGAAPFEGVPGGHIPGAVNFPSSELRFTSAAKALAKAGLTKDINIIVYCNVGRLSGAFIDALVKDFGYDPKKIKHYKGSMTDWAKNKNNIILPKDHQP